MYWNPGAPEFAPFDIDLIFAEAKGHSWAKNIWGGPRQRLTFPVPGSSLGRASRKEHDNSAEAAERFGYSPGAFRVLCHAFRRGELPEFFAAARTGPREQPKKSRAHEQIVALRKRNYSIYEISQALKVLPTA
jgi:hypothetical protein